MRYMKLMALVAAALALGACKSSNGRNLLPNVSGKAGEVMVVIEREQWVGNLGTCIRETLADDRSCYIGDIMENIETHRKLLGLPEYVFPAALLVFGYPTEQQKERQKPQRVDMQYIVHENQYKRMGNEELKNMFSIKATNGDYSAWISAFCSRKYNSDFAREMSRSVCEYLKQYEQY